MKRRLWVYGVVFIALTALWLFGPGGRAMRIVFVAMCGSLLAPLLLLEEVRASLRVTAGEGAAPGAGDGGTTIRTGAAIVIVVWALALAVGFLGLYLHEPLPFAAGLLLLCAAISVAFLLALFRAGRMIWLAYRAGAGSNDLRDGKAPDPKRLLRAARTLCLFTFLIGGLSPLGIYQTCMPFWHPHRPPSPEASAYYSLRTVMGAQTGYRDAYGRYARDFEELTSTANGPAFLLGMWPRWDSGVYTFEITPNADASSYSVTADPPVLLKPGRPHFYADSKGIIRSISQDRQATAADPVAKPPDPDE